MVDKRLKINQLLKNIIVKVSPEDCKKRFTTDPILDFPNQARYLDHYLVIQFKPI